MPLSPSHDASQESGRAPRLFHRTGNPPSTEVGVQTSLPDPIDVMGLPIRPLWTDQLVELLIARAKAGIRTSAAYANAHTVNLAWSHPSFLATLCTMDLLYADGMSVLLAGKLAGRELPERMTAADYSDWFAGRCAEEGVSLFFLGGEPGVSAQAAAALHNEFPNLKVAGVHHGFFEDTESPAVVSAINQSNARVLLVGMSSPRQESWVARHANEINVPVIWCVGALFDYYAGREPRGPDWLCRNGGEWLYRLGADPANKWRRYLIGNPLFAMRAIGWAWKHRHDDDASASEGKGGGSWQH
ncbi:MAG: WecB/TagA/CpsF family glycosyltransferase [Phycisphaerales bacterium]|nr:WecB/TagA/CpsF family glycosyltransferase [Phycisphaerales bacterium]